jgi:hypothetical protein
MWLCGRKGLKHFQKMFVVPYAALLLGQRFEVTLHVWCPGDFSVIPGNIYTSFHIIYASRC